MCSIIKVIEGIGELPTDDEITVLYKALVPVLSRASVGIFDTELAIDPSNSQRVNEIMMGVEVLLEVIRQKNGELERLLGDRAVQEVPETSLLDEILHRPPN